MNPEITFLIFDQHKTGISTQSLTYRLASRILLVDGFKRENRNADYVLSSFFDSMYNTYVANGWTEIGDYLTVGDHFSASGGQPYVITLHLTTNANGTLNVLHFSSMSNPSVGGLAPQKFSEANALLVNDPAVAGLNSTGLDLYRQWYNLSHNPQFGAAKKASIMNHIELLSSII